MTDTPSATQIPEGSRIGIGRTAEVFSWGEGQILKLYRPDFQRAWIEHEARVGRIVAGAGLAAPAVGDVIEVGGRLGIIMERIEGSSMLDDLAQRPWMLFRSARQFAEAHAAMHTCQRPELPSQRDSLARAIEYAPALPEQSRRQLLTTLLRLPDGDAVCHGDYHPDNLIVSPRGVIVIDWLTATRGNPAADVARTVLLFRIAVLPEGMPAAKRIMTQLLRRAFLGLYLRAYRRLRPISDTEIAIWLPILATARLNERIPAEETALLRLAGAEANTGHE
jgi:uncharacterized protein (TIGR02172 family)